MDKWELVHAYRRAVRRDLYEPLTCPEDPDMELAVTIGKDDQPEFVCHECHTVYRPGLDFYMRIKDEIL